MPIGNDRSKRTCWPMRVAKIPVTVPLGRVQGSNPASSSAAAGLTNRRSSTFLNAVVVHTSGRFVDAMDEGYHKTADEETDNIIEPQAATAECAGWTLSQSSNSASRVEMRQDKYLRKRITEVVAFPSAGIHVPTY